MEVAAEPVLRFAHYALLLGMFGWSAFWLLGLESLNLLKTSRSPGLAMLTAVAAPLVSAALMLFSIAAMMDTPVFDLDRSVIEAMIFDTGMGNAFIARTGLLLAGLAVLLALKNRRAAMAIAAACYGGALLTLGWNGHAAATEGGLGLFHRLNNGVHLISAGLWFGAIGWFLVLAFRFSNDADGTRPQALLGAMHRFAPMGVSLVALVAVTGTINSHLIFGLPNIAATLATPYGVLLAIKLIFVAAMVAVGAHHAHVSREASRCVDEAAARPTPILAALRRTLVAELTLGLLVTGMVAVFGTMSPPMM